MSRVVTFKCDNCFIEKGAPNDIAAVPSDWVSITWGACSHEFARHFCKSCWLAMLKEQVKTP